MTPTPRRVISQLALDAELWPLLRSDSMRRNGETPERYMPGRFVMRQPEEIREILKQLKSDDVADLLPIYTVPQNSQRKRYVKSGATW